MRVVGGVTRSEPLTGTFVTVPVVRSVIVALAPFELEKLRVVDCPALMVVAVAVNDVTVGAGVTDTVTVCVVLPALLEMVSV